MREPKDQNFYQYEVYELISECTHGGELDKEEFDNKISGLKAAALVDGHDHKWFMNMVSQCLFPVEESFEGDVKKKHASQFFEIKYTFWVNTVSPASTNFGFLGFVF